MSMTSNASKSASASEAGKTQASAAELVLAAAALAVGGAGPLPASGKDGDAQVAEQLSELLQDRALTVDELNLLYCYRFGINIIDALKCFDFEGTVQDFFVQQKRFSMNGGCVSVIPRPAVQEELAAVDETAVQERGKDWEVETASDAATESTAENESCYSDTESDVDVVGWHAVGARLADAIGDGEDDEDVVDVGAWRSVGARLVGALDEDRGLDVDAAGWRCVGARLIGALRHDDHEGVDTAAWRDVGSRLMAACAQSDDEDGVADACAAKWRAVGARVLRGLEDDECEQP